MKNKDFLAIALILLINVKLTTGQNRCLVEFSKESGPGYFFHDQLK